MAQWEYLITTKLFEHFSFKYTEQDYLNEFGKQGWQMTGVVQSLNKEGFPGLMKYYFKRPKSTPKKEPVNHQN